MVKTMGHGLRYPALQRVYAFLVRLGQNVLEEQMWFLLRASGQCPELKKMVSNVEQRQQLELRWSDVRLEHV